MLPESSTAGRYIRSVKRHCYEYKTSAPHLLLHCCSNPTGSDAGDLTTLQELWRACYSSREKDLESLAKVRNNWAEISVLHTRRKSSKAGRWQQQQQQQRKHEHELEVFEEGSVETTSTNSKCGSANNSIDGGGSLKSGSERCV